MEPLHTELLNCELPCAAYLEGGVYRLWQQSKPGAPALPTHIVWNMDDSSGTLLGELAEVGTGVVFGHIPEKVVTAQVNFIGDSPGVFYATLRSISTVSEEDTVALAATVYDIRGTVRLDSNSLKRFGEWTPDSSIVVGRTVYYNTDKDSTRRLYTGGVIPMDPYGTLINLFEGGSTTPYYVWKIHFDPYPFWSTRLSIPEEIMSAIGKLDDGIIEYLVYKAPLYVGTGNLEVHALLALWENAYLLGLKDSNLAIRSWRARSWQNLDTDKYRIVDPVKRFALATATKRLQVETIIREIMDIVGW